MSPPITSSTGMVLGAPIFTRHPLEAIFSPKTVAVIGATDKPGSVGRTILWNLISASFGGTVFPVNPKRPSVIGVKAYPSVVTVPETVDLAVIATPASSIPGIMSECVEAGVKGAIIISAGFRESGQTGVELERKTLEEARRGKIRIIGPNCLGVMNPITGLNATFAAAMAKPGKVGFISQSGALCAAILDWSFRENVGFSAFLSIGSMLDVGWGDLIYYLGDDPRTESIVIYMESIGDAASFLSAAREVALSKPIIVIKVGHTEAAAKAAASHTGSMTGSDDVLDAAFRRCGVLRVSAIEDLFYMAEVLAKQPRPKGPRLAILTNAGGPGVLATDALISTGGRLAELSGKTIESLNSILPVHWSHGNPVDILGDADSGRYAKALEAVAKDPGNDGLLTILTPQAMTNPTRTAEALKPYADTKGKPVLASWMGGAEVMEGEAILNKAGIPTFPYPDIAARIFNYMWKYSFNLHALYETPSLPPESVEDARSRAQAEEDIRTARKAGRTILTELESKRILSAFGIPVVETRHAATEDEAVQVAEKMGCPVVLKIHSLTITHKTDVGGVRLGLNNASEVREAFRSIKTSVAEMAGPEHFQGVAVQPMVKRQGYEVILGSGFDPQFGPVLLFGSGGQLVEVFRDRALALPPLNTTLAQRMMEETLIYKALKCVRGGKPIDLPALEQLIVQFSRLVAAFPAIKEIDVNPLLVSAEGLIALDARVVLHDPGISEDKLPKPAIRPYPLQYVSDWTLKGGAPMTIRPIRPEDEPMIVKFHQGLSERSVYFRYFQVLKLSQRVAHERLARICFIDYNRQMSLVACRKNPQSGEQEIFGVGRLTKIHGRDEAEFAILISDAFQKKGLGTELLRRLIQVARDEKLVRLLADILPGNNGMIRICEKLGFRLFRDPNDPVVKAELNLIV